MNASLRTKLVQSFYRVSRSVGLFHVARRLTGRGLRILCYHGFSLADEHLWRPRLFITPATFQKRLQYLQENGYPVLPLGEALARQEEGNLPACATVITIDDGFYSVYKVANELLHSAGFPSTLYLTTYYHQKGTPIFRLVVSYILWKCDRAEIDLSNLGVPALAGRTDTDLRDDGVRSFVESEIIRFGESECDEPTRVEISNRLALAAGVEYDEIVRIRSLSLIAAGEAQELECCGMAIESHTHRHRFPEAAEIARSELDDNQRSLLESVGHKASHFCYPSGEWSRQHWPILEDAGMQSATTCESGFVYAQSPRLALNRVLDAEEVSQLEFEAWMTGYSELIQLAKSALRLRSRV